MVLFWSVIQSSLCLRILTTSQPELIYWENKHSCSLRWSNIPVHSLNVYNSFVWTPSGSSLWGHNLQYIVKLMTRIFNMQWAVSKLSASNSNKTWIFCFVTDYYVSPHVIDMFFWFNLYYNLLCTLYLERMIHFSRKWKRLATWSKSDTCRKTLPLNKWADLTIPDHVTFLTML